MAERDPRYDPIAGDEVIFGPQWQSERYCVLKNLDGEIYYHMGTSRVVLSTSLKNWREWAAGGEVIRRGDRG